LKKSFFFVSYGLRSKIQNQPWDEWAFVEQLSWVLRQNSEWCDVEYLRHSRTLFTDPCLSVIIYFPTYH